MNTIMKDYFECIKKEVKKGGIACIYIEDQHLTDFLKNNENYKSDVLYRPKEKGAYLNSAYVAIFDTNSNLKFATIKLPNDLAFEAGTIIGRGGRNIKMTAKKFGLNYLKVVLE